MVDEYLSRHEFDMLRQQLQSDPRDLQFSALRGVPQMLERSWNVTAWSGLVTEWVRVYTFAGLGNQLYPDRVLDLSVITSVEVSAEDVVGVGYTTRWSLNGEPYLERAGAVLDGIATTYDERRLRLFASGSNYEQLMVYDTGITKTAEAVQANLADPWTLGLEVAFDEPGFANVAFNVVSALATLY